MFQRLLIVLLVALLPTAALAQKRKKPLPPRPKPTVANYAYGKDSDRQRLDFWQAKSDKPTPVVVCIHGGGWVGGTKHAYGRDKIQPFLDAGISVASIEYRFIPKGMMQHVWPPVKAPLTDAARAIQTIRSKAKEWNIDPQRIGATGSSAGACTSLWLAFHDDLADPKSDDPIARESTRLTCAAVVGAQTSLDPKQVREWIPNAIYGGHAFGYAAKGRNRAEEFELLLPDRAKVMPWIKEYSPIELVSSDDPPIYMSYAQKHVAKPGQEERDPTHAAMYGIKLAEKLHDAGVEAIVTYPAKPDTTKYKSLNDFLIEKLTAK